MSLTIKIYDLETNLLADISGIALEKTMSRLHNQSTAFTVTVPATHSLVTATAGDGYRVLRKGNRKLLVWEDGTIIFHGRIWLVERTGDDLKQRATLTAYDALMELGYSANASGGAGGAGRPVRDATGNLIDPHFTSSVGGQTKISGPDLIRQVIENSVGNVTTIGDPNLHEGQLPIDLTTGTFDVLSPPAVDLSVLHSMQWPMMIGDFVSLLVETEVVDLKMRPVDPTEGLDPYVMGALSAVSSGGVDRHTTVHFDYFTGSKNAKAARHIEDFKEICNKLYYYLGPRLTDERWKGNITPGSPGTDFDATSLAASRSRYGGSGGNPGEWMALRALDTTASENVFRPLYLALWNAEQGLRREPRELLYITPAPGAKALFDPPHDFDAPDKVKLNVNIGVDFADVQRVYGYTKTWSRQNVASVSELLTSADT